MNILKIIVSIIVLIIMSYAQVHSQSKISSKTLQDERNALNREIAEIQASINNTRKSKKITLREMQLLQKKLTLRKQILANIEKQVKSINQNIDSIGEQVKITSNLLENLKKEYAIFIVSSYERKTSLNIINFLFNTQDLYSAIRTLNYLKFFRESQATKAKAIRIVSKKLQQKLHLLEQQKQEQLVAKTQQTQEQKSLENDKKDKAQVIKVISSKEKNLLNQFYTKKKRDAQLKAEITQVIKKEVALQKKLARERELKKIAAEKKKMALLAKKNTTKTHSSSVSAKKPEPVSTISTSTLDDAEKEMNQKFISFRGKMPWPVKGIIVTSFGEDIFQGSQVSGASIGTDFQTAVGAPVRAICDGLVSVVFNQNGMMVIIIRHGLYFSAYSNLMSTSVSKGDFVKMGQIIGNAGASEDHEKGEVLLILSNDKGINLNPEIWLTNR
ncbi:MAG: murein hydrolase activator EnvC family protein [Chitinophagaceae bacterium]